MIIEAYDILENKRAVGHAPGLPPGISLRDVLQRDENTKRMIPCITQLTVNGQMITEWQDYCPGANDRIVMTIVPRAPAGLLPLLTLILQVVSVISFIVGLFLKPKSPKQQRGSQPSSTYSFEGIQDTVAPGDVVPVTYGQHRKGGQLLMYYLNMTPDWTGLAMNMLLSLGEGPVDNIGEVELNELGISAVASVTIATRLGTSSQSIIPGFETIKNTFHDGREITDEVAAQNPDNSIRRTSLIYRTIAYDVAELEVFVSALQGLTCRNVKGSKIRPNTSRYAIYFNNAASTSECDSVVWTFYATRSVTGNSDRPYWDNAHVIFPYQARWDVKIEWDGATCQPPWNNNRHPTYRLWLQDVTEVRGASGPYSGEALLGIRAAPTRTLHGGRPNATTAMRGRTVNQYVTPTSFTTGWSQNPSWAVLDYLTNSRYGHGAHSTIDDMDIQSFIDFATLANSLVDICQNTVAGCYTSIGQCDGTEAFHFGDPPAGDGGYASLDNGIPSDPAECMTLFSKYNGQNQYGICITRMCCPPRDEKIGVEDVNLSGPPCNEHTLYIDKVSITTGNPVFGLVAYVASGSTKDNFTGYGQVYHHGSKTLSLVRWNNQAVNTYGTILATVGCSLGIASQYHIFDVIGRDPSTGTTIVAYAENSGSNPFAVNSFLEAPPSNFSAGGCGGLATLGLNGIVVLPNGGPGDFHGVKIEDFVHWCFNCYDNPSTPVNSIYMDFSCVERT